jgi:hypothetical protein
MKKHVLLSVVALAVVALLIVPAVCLASTSNDTYRVSYTYGVTTKGVLTPAMTVPKGGAFSAKCTKLVGSNVTYTLVDAVTGSPLSAARAITPASGMVTLWRNTGAARSVRVSMKTSSGTSAVSGFWYF